MISLQSNQENSPNYELPSEAVHQKSKAPCREIYGDYFQNCLGINFVYYLGKNKTISGTRYASLMDWLSENKVGRKRPRLAHKKFHQDDTRTWITEVRFQLVRQLPYFPYLTPCFTIWKMADRREISFKRKCYC